MRQKKEKWRWQGGKNPITALCKPNNPYIAHNRHIRRINMDSTRMIAKTAINKPPRIVDNPYGNTEVLVLSVRVYE
ncbi:MAG: hypothetical protein ACYSR6_09110 [Planctomycetota bacterium]